MVPEGITRSLPLSILLVCFLAPTARAQVRPGGYSGEYRLEIGDDFERGLVYARHVLVTEGGFDLVLHFQTLDGPPVEPGSTVRVEGRRFWDDGWHLDVDPGSLQVLSGPPAAGGMGELAWAIVLVTHQGLAPPQDYATAAANAEIVDHLFLRSSYGLTGFTGILDPDAPADIFGDPDTQVPVVLEEGNCSIINLRNLFQEAYPRVDVLEYDRIMFVMKGAGTCSLFSGGTSWGSLGGWWTIVKNASGRVMTHELGHNQGFGHSGSYDRFVWLPSQCEFFGPCCDIPTVGIFGCESDSYLAYGDRFCPQGGGYDQFNAWWKVSEGWMPAENVIDHDLAAGETTFLLAPTDEASADPQVLRIPYDASRDYYVEFRLLEDCVAGSQCDTPPFVDVHVAPVSFSNFHRVTEMGKVFAGESYTDVFIDGGLGMEISVCSIDEVLGATLLVRRPVPFVRGDANGDGAHDVADAVTILTYVQTGSNPANLPVDAFDADDDGDVDTEDALYLLEYLFQGGDPPPAPFPYPGLDMVSDSLWGGADCR